MNRYGLSGDLTPDQQRALDYLLNAVTEYRCSGSQRDLLMMEQRWQEWLRVRPMSDLPTYSGTPGA